MEISAALAADLTLLTEALDEPSVDIVETVRQLARDAHLAVGSYVGLTVSTTAGGPTFAFTVIAEHAEPEDIRSSVLMPLTQLRSDRAGVDLVVILYAAKEGAFVDLAADLSWLIGCDLDDFVLDQHLVVVESDGGGVLAAESRVNQAIGVLINRGYTPEHADRELDVRAIDAGTDRQSVAASILAEPFDELPEGDPV